MRAPGCAHRSLHSSAASDSVGDGDLGGSASERETTPPSEILSRSVPPYSPPMGGGRVVEGSTSPRLRTQLRLEAEGPTPGSAAKPTVASALSALPPPPSYGRTETSLATKALREAASENPGGAHKASSPVGTLSSGQSPASRARPGELSAPLGAPCAREGDCGVPQGKPTEANSLTGVAGKEGSRRRPSCPTSSSSPSENWSVCTGGDVPQGSAPPKCSCASPEGGGRPASS